MVPVRDDWIIVNGVYFWLDFGIFRLMLEPASVGYRADAMLNTGKADSATFKVGLYPDLNTAKAKAPADMRDKIIASLKEIP